MEKREINIHKKSGWETFGKIAFGIVVLIVILWFIGSNSESSCQEGYVLGSDNLCHVICGNGYCSNDATCFNGQCIICPTGTFLATDGECYPNQNTPDYSSTSSETTQVSKKTLYQDSPLYYSTYCSKINPFNIVVREASSNAVREHPGAYNIDQVLDIYDWVKSNIIYLNVPVTLDDSPYSPEETLKTKAGDCKNQAVLLASMINSIGGTAEIVLNPSCKHAYTLVYFTDNETSFDSLIDDISIRYQKQLYIEYYLIDGGYWVILDTAGGTYPGETISECSQTTEIYSVSSCAVKSN